MKKICLIFAIIGLILCFSNAALASETVKLKTTFFGEKTQYNKGEDVYVYLSIEEACSNFGLLIGSLEFDDNYIEYKSNSKFPIIVDNTKGIELKIYPQFIDIGLDDKSNQIFFWLEDKQNRMKNCDFAYIQFLAKQDFNINEIDFEYKNVKAGDYDETISFEVEDVSKENKKPIIVEKKENIIEKEIQDKINDTRKSISEYVNQGNDKAEEEKKETKKQFWSNASSWAIKELEEAQSKGLIPETFENKDFTKPITRKDFAAVAVKLYEKLSNKEAIKASKETFNDTEDEYVLKAYSVGITEGTSKEKALFSPNNEITREQMATMMLRAINKAGINTKVDLDSTTKFVDDGEMHDWSREAIYYMSSNNIINGISTKENRFGVKNTATIDQSVAISLRTINSTK
ncbi:MAG: S-layer homology domain-containing protein [Clostridia bacterium]|nr:S-layer homology domain-containing protein [Clostridia bacterium]